MALLTPPRLRLLIEAVVCLGATIVFAQPAAPIEANIKAVFLFNFTKYVTWPASGIGERSPSDIRICVTANDDFFSLLKAAVEGEAVDGKPLVPVALDVLTVGDGELNDETVIAFVRDDNRIRFDINRAAADRRNLNISAKLLRLARKVRDR